MTLAARALRFFGFGAPRDGGRRDKDFRKGTFSEPAAAARDAFFKHKNDDPKVKPIEEMTPLERRMQSGSI